MFESNVVEEDSVIEESVVNTKSLDDSGILGNNWKGIVVLFGYLS